MIVTLLGAKNPTTLSKAICLQSAVLRSLKVALRASAKLRLRRSDEVCRYAIAFKIYWLSKGKKKSWIKLHIPSTLDPIKGIEGVQRPPATALAEVDRIPKASDNLSQLGSEQIVRVKDVKRTKKCG